MLIGQVKLWLKKRLSWELPRSVICEIQTCILSDPADPSGVSGDTLHPILVELINELFFYSRQKPCFYINF